MRSSRSGRASRAATWCVCLVAVCRPTLSWAFPADAGEAPAPSVVFTSCDQQPCDPPGSPPPREPPAGADAGTPPSPASPPRSTVVTGQRGLAIGESAAATTLLTPREVREQPARTSDDLLRSVAQVQIPRAQSAFEHPTAQSVSMRGVGNGRTLVLFDGVPVNDAFGSWVLWNKVPLAEVDRVEVVRGAGANVYGNLAMGGVIQLFRAPADRDRLGLVAEYGGQDTYRVGADGTVRAGESVAVTVYGQALKSGGSFVIAPELRGPVDQREPFEGQNLGARVDLELSKEFRAFVSASFTHEARTAGTALTTNGLRLGEGAAGIDFHPDAATLWRARLFASTQDYTNVNTRISADRSSEVVAVENEVPSTREGVSLVWSHRFGERQVLTFGADAQQSAATNTDRVFDPGGSYTGTRTAGGDQLLLGAFGEWSLSPSEAWTLTAGLRGDLWSNEHGLSVDTAGVATALPTHRDGAVTPRLSAQWRASDTLALRAGLYSAFRAPTLNELYRGFISGGVSFLPNAALGAERLYGGELGADWSIHPALRLGVTGYATELFGLVQSVTLDPKTSQRQNLGEARAIGLEADARWRPIRPLTVTASYALTRTQVVANPANPALVGNRLPNQPLHRGALTAALELPRLFTASGRLWTESLAWSDDRNSFPLPAFAVVDLSVARRLFEPVELYASVANLFDAQVITSRNASTTSIGTPRTAWVGLRANY